VVHFPELPLKGDVSDFIARGGTRDDLVARIDAASLWQPRQESASTEVEEFGLIARRASEIQAQPIDWLWPNRIAIGKQTLIAGDPGLGKSQLTAFQAAIVTTANGPAVRGEPRKAALLYSVPRMTQPIRSSLG
jgi:hypothetical protein